MAIESPILCVVRYEEEARQFKNAIAALCILNPIDCVSGAPRALDFFEQSARKGQQSPALVFLSLTAPEANRLAAWFEAHPTNRPGGLIAMTGFTDMRPIIQAYHLGVTAFLEWPLKTEDLRNALTSNPDLKLEQSDSGLTISRL